MARARNAGKPPKGFPHTDFVSGRCHIGVVVDPKFDNLVSSHCVEHHADLIGHLSEVSQVLRPGGRPCLIVPISDLWATIPDCRDANYPTMNRSLAVLRKQPIAM